jgi:HPt (histidine-containing phosphotransfer) domain-containing protein
MDISELIHSFVEDCREHLDSIESSLMDIEAAGDHQNPELVNSVFRLAHSIKGGAGMLGLDNIKTLAHKLENVLHMVRSNELKPTHTVVDVLLKGFDRLTFLVDNIHESETLSIDAQVAQLLTISHPDGEAADAKPTQAQFEVGNAGIFSVDAISLEQAKGGGNELYLLEFDLIHDIHGKGRMPFEVLKMLMDTGRIVDCKVDFAAVGDLDAFGNSIPFYVLFATILEPKYVSGLVKLPDDRVRHIDNVPHAVVVLEPSSERKEFGALAFCVAEGLGVVQLPEEITAPVLDNLRDALLFGLERCSGVVLEWSAVSRCDVFFYQMILAARRSYAERSRSLCAAAPLPVELHHACQLQGFLGPEGSGNLLPLA